MRIIVCDDDNTIANFISSSISSKYKMITNIEVFTSAKQMINYIKAIPSVDLIIMDICLGNENGIECINEEKDSIANIPVIFVTGYMEYCQDIFMGVKPWGLLTKPISEQRLHNYIDSIIKISEEKTASISVNFNRTKTSIKLSEIIYIESCGRKVIYHTNAGVFEEYIKLDDVCEKLNDSFVRCHKSYAVNLDSVSDVTDTEIILINNSRLPVSRKNKGYVKNKFLEYKTLKIGL